MNTNPQPIEPQPTEQKPVLRVLLIFFSLTGVPAALSTYLTKLTQNLWLIIGLFLAYEVLVFFIGIISGAANILSGRWAQRIADFVDLKSQKLFSPFYKQYIEYIVYKHRDFDVKGLSTQGIYALEMEKVFVELSMVPQTIDKAGKSLVPSIETGLNGDSRSIWDFLKSDTCLHLAIIGSPGSGKTTLLKHLALAVVQREKLERQVKTTVKLPVILYLRDYVQIIKEKSDYELTQAICDQLIKNKVPISPDWFNVRLKKGKVLIMLDGFDEVANPEDLKKVGEWVEHQIEIWGKYKNRFIITSRPHGYQTNPLSHINLLEVRPFNNQQINRFIDNWYLANEIMSHHKDDPGVRMLATQGADDLRKRLQSASNLLELAVNPLLLTMITTVHRYRSSLPGRRVELYQEICEVFLGKRQLSKGIVTSLTPAQKEFILRPLAYHLMCDQKREVNLAKAKEIIGTPLHRVELNLTEEDFLKMIESSSGLLIEREEGVYSFAHLTFQEYLASVYIREQQLENEIINQIEDRWWHEVIRLYCAKSNASGIIRKCLELVNSSVSSLSLAIECMDEALEMDEKLRVQLQNVLINGVEDPNYERRRVVANALLNLRLHRMSRISDDKYIDASYITHVEYHLFLDEMRKKGKYYQPDHWKSYQFPKNKGQTPVVGVRSSDAVAFCEWLTKREGDNWIYRIPSVTEILELNQEIASVHEETLGKQMIGYWLSMNDGAFELSIKTKKDAELIFEQAKKDLLVCFSSFKDQEHIKILIHTLVSSFDLSQVLDTPYDLDQDLTRIRDRVGDLQYYFDRNLGRNNDLDQNRVMSFAFVLARDLNYALERIFTLALTLDHDRTRARAIGRYRDLDPAFDLARALVNDLSPRVHAPNRARNCARNLEDNLKSTLERYRNFTIDELLYNQYLLNIRIINILLNLDSNNIPEKSSLILRVLIFYFYLSNKNFIGQTKTNLFSKFGRFLTYSLGINNTSQKKSIAHFLLNCYIDLVILEKRGKGELGAFEGIKFLKEMKRGNEK